MNLERYPFLALIGLGYEAMMRAYFRIKANQPSNMSRAERRRLKLGRK